MRMYLSGLESWVNYISVENIKKSRYILLSYFYIKKAAVEKNKQFMKLFREYNDDNRLLIDSGAFTFMNTKKNATKKDLDVYVSQYIKFIKKYNINQFVEMDIDALFGYKQALLYRSMIESATGKKCIPIWHKQRGIEDFKKMCENYDYAGIGGIVIGDIKRNEIWKVRKLALYAKSKGCNIHVMGYTPKNINDAKNAIYSADSTSWIGGLRFGTIKQFNGFKMVATETLDGRKWKNNGYQRTANFLWTEWTKYQLELDEQPDF